MDIIQLIREELTEEYNTTKTFFAIYPDEQHDFKPHEKSMSLQHLATHIAAIFGWTGYMLTTHDLDLAKAEAPKLPESANGFLSVLDENYTSSLKALDEATERDLLPCWSLSMNGRTLKEWTTYGAIRHALNQITHHRAQLGVYYRLLDIPLPGSYGPTADQQHF